MKKLFAVALSFAATACTTAGGFVPAKPDKFLIYVGQLSSGVTMLSLEKDELVLQQTIEEDGKKRASEKRYHPSADQWKRFKTDLDNMKVWNWYSNYDPGSNVVVQTEGPQWKVTFQFGEQLVQSQGNTVFPPGDEIIWRSKGYQDLCASVRRLIQDQFC